MLDTGIGYEIFQYLPEKSQVQCLLDSGYSLEESKRLVFLRHEYACNAFQEVPTHETTYNATFEQSARMFKLDRERDIIQGRIPEKTVLELDYNKLGWIKYQVEHNLIER